MSGVHNNSGLSYRSMERDWVQFALKLAEGARAKVAEDRRRLEMIRNEQLSKRDEQPVGASR
jgi:hypothetical protein